MICYIFGPWWIAYWYILFQVTFQVKICPRETHPFGLGEYSGPIEAVLLKVDVVWRSLLYSGLIE
jgi:hypothetical protein